MHGSSRLSSANSASSPSIHSLGYNFPSGVADPNSFPPYETHTNPMHQVLAPAPIGSRPRAGTMPSLLLPFTSATNADSNAALALQYAANASLPSSTRISPASTRVPSPSTPSTTILQSTFSQSAAQASGDRRLRSGSLTLQLPKNNVANAFGPGVFSGAWTPSLEDVKDFKSESDPLSPGGSSATGADESFASPGSKGKGGQHAAKRTLSFLGLNDPASPSSATSNSFVEAGQNTPAAQNLTNSVEAQTHLARAASPGNRIRANTIAAASTPRQTLNDAAAYQSPHANIRRRLSAAHLLTLSSLAETESADGSVASLHEAVGDMSLAADSDQDGIQDHLVYSQSVESLGQLGGRVNAFGLSRPRASTNVMPPEKVLSMLTSRRRAGTAAANVPFHFDPSEQYVDHHANSTSSGSPTAEINSPLSATRSLWIGNLTQSVSVEELTAHFLPYGLIESVRILPEKMCAFVNYTTLQAAITAREDILSRLQGQLLGSIVRIGYGKIDTPSMSPYNQVGTPASGSPESALQSTPTRALWVGSVPTTTTPAELSSLFAPFGHIESARVLAHKNCGFINMSSVEDAILARKALTGRELFGSDAGPVKIGYAKVQSRVADEPPPPAFVPSQLYARLEQAAPIYPTQAVDQNLTNQVNHAGHLLQAAVVSLPSRQPTPTSDVNYLRSLMTDLCGPADSELASDLDAVSITPPTVTYASTIPLPVPLADYNEVHRKQQLEAPSLRDLRKRLEHGTLPPNEVDRIALELVGQVPLLASDYIGNNIVQKFYEMCSFPVKMAMLERIVPSLASIGCHKNGTWAAQKIMSVLQDPKRVIETGSDLAATPDEANLICFHLKAYIPLLLLDQFGNYVVQCCLRFGCPLTAPFFDAMVQKCWEIGQGRFGARSMRTVLESPYVPRYHQKRIAIAIAMNGPDLATNGNGTLLLSWLLDTSGLPGRYKLLASQLHGKLSFFISHKIASNTVLKLITQSSDAACSETLLSSIFGPSPTVLQQTLREGQSSAAFFTKLLGSPSLANNRRKAWAVQIQDGIRAAGPEAATAYNKLSQDIASGFVFEAQPERGQSPAQPRSRDISATPKASWTTPRGQQTPTQRLSSNSVSPNHRPLFFTPPPDFMRAGSPGMFQPPMQGSPHHQPNPFSYSPQHHLQAYTQPQPF